MHLSSLDWVIIVGFLVLLVRLNIFGRRYVHGVGDYLAANRCARRYLLTVATSVGAFGAVTLAANFEKFYSAGFAAMWWWFMMIPLQVILAMTGWVAYRYRETRALTMAQFFEIRYSRRFRAFAGGLSWISGLLNYSIGPGIAANLIGALCGLPAYFSVVGYTCPTVPILMIILLTLSLSSVLFGGFITVLLTDFVQSQFIFLAAVISIVALLISVQWGHIETAVVMAPAGKSLINPFDQCDIEGFNIWFFLLLAFKLFYNCMGWQSGAGYGSAARSPHEAKMAQVLSVWRGILMNLILLLLPLSAYAVMHLDLFAPVAAEVRHALDAITDPQIRKQVMVPSVIGMLLPIGVKGLLIAAIIGCTLGADTSAIHSWGNIFIQDVLLPLRRKPLSPKTHLLLLRLSAVAVAVFAFFWSLWFPLKDYIYMYLLLTGTLYLGGSGAVIIGGLYWKRATTAGAWTSMIAGAVIAIVGVILQTAWQHVPWLLQWSPTCPINGAGLAMLGCVSSIVAFVGVSLVTYRAPFNLAAMLHHDETKVQPPSKPSWKDRLQSSLGFTSEFSRSDRWLYYGQLCWVGLVATAFVLGSLLAWGGYVQNPTWLVFWRICVILGGIAGLVTVIWFTIGGVHDLICLFRDLNTMKRDSKDDGRVEHAPETAQPGSATANQR